MALSTTAKLGAGSKLYFENPASPGAYKLLDNATALGQTGAQGEFVEKTPISKTVREYLRGLKTPPQKQLDFNDESNANYDEFLGVWDDEANVDEINMRIDFANGRRASFVLVPNGRVMDEPQGNAALKMLCFAQQTGNTTWSTY
jgi:hypothetical protein